MPHDLIPRWGRYINWLTPFEEDLFTWDWNPQSGLEISEDDKHVYVKAAVPGVDPSKIEVTYDKGVLWIKGETEEEEKDKAKKFYRRSAQSFQYRVMVPGDIDETVEPEATTKHGVMTVTFTKTPKKEPKKIKVKTA